MTACVYCGQDRTLTNEDVWPTWIAGLPRTTNGAKGQFTNVVESLTDPTIPKLEWDAVGNLGQRARVVCGECNHGWMSMLEGEARRLLSPMIMGQPVTLTPPEQQNIAWWVTKTHQMYLLGIVRCPPS